MAARSVSGKIHRDMATLGRVYGWAEIVQEWRKWNKVNRGRAKILLSCWQYKHEARASESTAQQASMKWKHCTVRNRALFCGSADQ